MIKNYLYSKRFFTLNRSTDLKEIIQILKSRSKKNLL